MALGLGIGPSGGGGGGGGASLTQDLTYGSSVAIGDMALSHDMRLDTDATVAGAFTLNVPTGDPGNFLITARNTNGVVDLTLGTNVVLENTNFGNGWNNADGATNIIAGSWDGSIARITIIAAGQDPDAPVTLAEAPAASFDGINDWATRGANLTGIADGPGCTFSFWYQPARLATFTDRRIIQAGNNKFQVIHDDATNELSVSSRNAAGTINFAGRTDGFIVYGDGWVHVLGTLNAVTDQLVVYFNDVLQTFSLNGGSGTDDNINFTGAGDWAIGSALPVGTQPFIGDLSELWWDDQIIDLSVEANRRKFIDVNGQPVDLGANGENPTGVSPKMYFSGEGDAFLTNKGTGGAFTLGASTSLGVPDTQP